MFFSIEEANKFCEEKIQNVNHNATKSKEMVEAGLESKIEKISYLLSEYIKTIEDRDNEVNRLFEKLERVGMMD